MIRGHCFTNLDEWKREEWPTVFAAVPRVGECVRATSRRYLKVVRVTHYEHREMNPIGAIQSPYPRIEPRIEVELHK